MRELIWKILSGWKNTCSLYNGTTMESNKNHQLLGEAHRDVGGPHLHRDAGLFGKQQRNRVGTSGQLDLEAEATLEETADADVILRMKKLNFLSGSAVIPPEAYVLLDNAITSIGIFPDRAVRVEGHTDFMGTNDYNQKLSERRANAVRDYLTSQMEGSENRISAIGHGEEKPIANNETAEGRTKNRRIDIVLIAPPAPSEEE